MDDVELIVVANGCTDNTEAYLDYLETAVPNLSTYSTKDPLGFAKAVNKGIDLATTNKIVLLNNDTVLLEQPKNEWLRRLDQGDVTSVLTQHSRITNSKFGVFFCTMIDSKVIKTIGRLNEDYETGGCEDIEFCHLAELAGFKINDCGWQGDFPIYHKAEGTMHDEALVQDWKQKFLKNQLRLAKKFNKDQYYYLLSNNYERAVFLKGDVVFPRETQRYQWAELNCRSGSVLEIGCSTGYGKQFLSTTDYTGLDYDPIIVDVANEQNWGHAKFEWADINNYELDFYDTIIAFEVIEHLDNGLEIVEKLKKHCNRLLITVPHNEPKGFWGEHHKLHGLTEKDFPGFQIEYIDEHGNISSVLRAVDQNNRANLMIMRCDNE
jgi:2-polyprenyl-3-methyl-5-hydroxy-6-metoxy-1,4-benzoquinol methylase